MKWKLVALVSTPIVAWYRFDGPNGYEFLYCKLPTSNFQGFDVADRGALRALIMSDEWKLPNKP